MSGHGWGGQGTSLPPALLPHRISRRNGLLCFLTAIENRGICFHLSQLKGLLSSPLFVLVYYWKAKTIKKNHCCGYFPAEIKYLTRARWGGGSLLKIPFFKGQKMHKPITLILFVPMRDKVFRALPSFCPQTSVRKFTHGRSIPLKHSYDPLTALLRISWGSTQPRKWHTVTWPAWKCSHNPARPGCTSSVPTGSHTSSLFVPACQKDGSCTYFQCMVVPLCHRITPHSIWNNLSTSPFSPMVTRGNPTHTFHT